MEKNKEQQTKEALGERRSTLIQETISHRSPLKPRNCKSEKERLHKVHQQQNT